MIIPNFIIPKGFECCKFLKKVNNKTLHQLPHDFIMVFYCPNEHIDGKGNIFGMIEENRIILFGDSLYPSPYIISRTTLGDYYPDWQTFLRQIFNEIRS